MVMLCVTPPSAAVIVVVPGATAVTKPMAFTVAVTVEEELQVTREDKSRLLPSL